MRTVMTIKSIDAESEGSILDFNFMQNFAETRQIKKLMWSRDNNIYTIWIYIIFIYYLENLYKMKKGTDEKSLSFV